MNVYGMKYICGHYILSLEFYTRIGSEWIHSIPILHEAQNYNRHNQQFNSHLITTA